MPWTQSAPGQEGESDVNSEAEDLGPDEVAGDGVNPEMGYEEGDAPPETTAGAVTAADERIAALEAELGEVKDRFLRSVAEMENVRRRARLDVEEAHRFANSRLITDLLPVLDNFLRALDAATQTDNLAALQDGVTLIHRQLEDALERAGLSRISAVGERFDPNLHEAIMQVPAEEGQEPMTVIEELRGGFRLHDRVLRPSLVKVTSA